jgi:hypothetical protein
MVSALKNTQSHKRILLMILLSLLFISAFSIFSFQFHKVSAQTPAASLTGTTSDMGLDTDGNGVFDFLEIGVEINVSIAGTFQVEVVGLYDSDFAYFNVTNQSSVDLDVGIHVVDVFLDGDAIYNSGISPSSIAIITLYTDSEKIDEAFDISLSREYYFGEFQPGPIIVDIQFDKVQREIKFGQGESLHITNTYSITNKGSDTSTIGIGLPEDSYDVVVRDEMGNLEASFGSANMTVNLRETLFTNETAMLYQSYYIPWEKGITQQNGLNYNLRYTFYENFNWTIGELTISIVLPEGAEFQSSNPSNPSNIEKGNLQDRVTFAFSNVTPSEDLHFEVNYRYILFWSSLYPTVWVGALVVVVSVFAFLWKGPKPTIGPIIVIPPEDIRKFVDAYEEKERIMSELESMESRLRKRKIPRRRFKVRKKMLDGRLSTISRDLSSLHEKIRAAGPKYANMMRQIEVAETNLEGAERDIQRVKVRYRRGEVSKGAYGKLMDEYKHRREEAEATVDGVILRLREEIR